MKFIALLVGIVVLGGGYFVYSKKMAPQDAPLSDSQKMESEGAVGAESAETSGKRTLASIMAGGGSHVCTFSSEDPNAKNSGTVYVSGDEIRGDFTSTVEAAGMTMKSYMLQTGDMVYTWSDMTPQGFKTPSAQPSGDTAQPMSDQMSFDAGVEMSYDCKPWARDAAKFAVPTTVSFVEMPKAPVNTR